MRTYKLVILGSGGVGKSALTLQFVENRFVTNYDPTIEDCYQKIMKDFILEIYDTAENFMLKFFSRSFKKRPKAVFGKLDIAQTQHKIFYKISTKKSSKFYGKKSWRELKNTSGIDQFAVSKDELIRSGDGFALVYSITSRTTCNDLEEFREQIIRIKSSSNVPMILIGNKCDLEDERKVLTSYGERLALIYKCKFFETSAKNRKNVENMFFHLSQLIIDKERAEKEREQEQNFSRKKSFYQSSSSLFKKKKKNCQIL